MLYIRFFFSPRLCFTIHIPSLCVSHFPLESLHFHVYTIFHFTRASSLHAPIRVDDISRDKTVLDRGTGVRYFRLLGRLRFGR